MAVSKKKPSKGEFSGVYAALLTPFDERGRVSERRLRALAGFLVSKGADGLYICGASGEALLMEAEERERVVEIVKDAVRDRAKLIVHVGGARSTESAVRLARHAEKMRLDGISAMPPPYYGHRFDETFDYYRELGECTDLPFLIYYIPSLAGVTISNDRMGQLASIRNVVGLKYADANLYVLQDLLRVMGGKWIALSGADELCLPALTVGAVGCIGTTQNVLPELFLEIYKEFRDGKVREAMALQARVSLAVSLLLKYGRLASWKSALRFRGVDGGLCRRPFKPGLSADDERAFQREWKTAFPEFSEGV